MAVEAKQALLFLTSPRTIFGNTCKRSCVSLQKNENIDCNQTVFEIICQVAESFFKGAFIFPKGIWKHELWNSTQTIP